MVRRLAAATALSVAALATQSPPALAAGGGPSASSPAGTMYSVPLTSARGDAAPHGHAAGHSSGSGSAGTGSGPGGPAAGAGSSVGAVSQPAGGGSGHAGRPVRHRRHRHTPARTHTPARAQPAPNQFASSSRVPGLNGPTTRGINAAGTAGSSAPLLAIALAVLVLAVGSVVGARAVRRRPQQAGEES